MSFMDKITRIRTITASGAATNGKALWHKGPRCLHFVGPCWSLCSCVLDSLCYPPLRLNSINKFRILRLIPSAATAARA